MMFKRTDVQTDVNARWSVVSPEVVALVT
jgi:hypothetical protein